MKPLAISLGIAAALSGLAAPSARAQIMNPDVTFTLQNFPGGVTSLSSTIGNGLTTVGTVQVFTVQVPTPGGGEWDDFFFSTADGSPLAANSALNWAISAAFTLSQSASFDGIENQWTTGGANPPNGLGGTPVPLADLTPSGFDNYAGNGPLGPGYVNGYGASGNALITSFSAALPAGPEVFPTFVDPYSFANTGGGIPTDADGFNIAFHFDPLSAVPEPGALALVCAGGAALLAGYGLRRRRG